VGRVADNTGLSEPSVDRLLKDAVAAGLLFVVRKGRPGRGGRSTIFRLAMPEAEIPSPVRRFRRKNTLTAEAKNPENTAQGERRTRSNEFHTGNSSGLWAGHISRQPHAGRSGGAAAR
jgi:hypothetical protein